MSSLFSFRTEREPWGGIRGFFLFILELSVEHLKSICPKWGDNFQNVMDNYWNGIVISLDETTFEEEKQILESLKLGYQDCLNNAEYWKSTFGDPEYFSPFLKRFKNLIDLIEEEIHDIERGKLILQEDGTAIVNEDFREV